MVKHHYKISDYNSEVQNLKDIIMELNEFGRNRKMTKSLTLPITVPIASKDEDIDNSTSDDCSASEMMCCFESDSEDSESEEEKE